MSDVALFDMDETLTPARGKISDETISHLMKLSRYADIGIISGSDFGMIKSQVLDRLSDKSLLRKIHVFPCNGTKVFSFNDTSYDLKYEVDMMQAVGYDKFFTIYSFLISQQSLICSDNLDLKIKGDFITNRGSMINYCIPGRGSSPSDRDLFQYLDRTRSIRKKIFSRLKTFMTFNEELGLDASLGGQTSIDIYPTGWDKSYVIRHLTKYDRITFVGDKCEQFGNDKPLFDIRDEMENFLGLKTVSPENTCDIILEKLIPILGIPGGGL